MLHTLELRAVSWDSNSLGARLQVREGVEGCDSGIASGGFAGRYVDFGGARLEESNGFISIGTNLSE